MARELRDGAGEAALALSLGPRTGASRWPAPCGSAWSFNRRRFTRGLTEKIDVVFSSEWQIPTKRLPGRKPFTPKTLGQIGLFNDDLLFAANALDGFLNGESLILVLDIGKARLLLPGDAEVGAWTNILEIRMHWRLPPARRS